MPKKEITLEQSLERLNLIVNMLDDPDISVDEALKIYEEGIKTVRSCKKKIENAKQKIKYIDEEGENNTNE